MSILDKLIRILKDDYKVGAESTSRTPVVYLDANKFDSRSLEALEKLKKIEEKIASVFADALKGEKVPDEKELEKMQEDYKAAKEEFATIAGPIIAEQFDSQFQGISEHFSASELAELFRSSFEEGPFSLKPAGGAAGLVCIINKPVGDEFKPENIYSTFKLGFKPEHMRPFPGSTALIKELVGAHEGEHCNQDIILRVDPDAALKILRGEVGADIAAIKLLRQMGQHETAQAFIDLRALAAANGDFSHASSIFLDKPGFQVPTKEHLEAAKAFKQEMVDAVAAQSGLSKDDAEKLRTEDPQRFAKIVQKALDEGTIPAPKIRELTQEERKDLVAKDMGITREQFDALGPDKLPDIMKSYDKLQAEGAFTKNEANPYIRDYVESYVGAVTRLMVPDTSPKADPKAESKVEAAAVIVEKKEAIAPVAESAVSTAKVAVAEEPELTAEQRIAALTAEDHLKDAEDNYKDIVKWAVAERLEISIDDAKKLMDSDDPAAIAALEDLIREDKISSNLVMVRSEKEVDAILAKHLGVSADDLSKVDRGKQSLAYDVLNNSGAFHIEYENPYILDRIKQHIDAHHKTHKSGPYIEPEPAVDKPVSKMGSYDYVALLPNLNNGSPQIDKSGLRDQLMIGDMSASSYFFARADRVSAEQQIALREQAALSMSAQFSAATTTTPRAQQPPVG